MKNLFYVALLAVFLTLHAASFDDIYERQEQNQWFKDGIETIKAKLKVKPINKKAKNVIIFLGDGMGISTVTAGRILDGQLKNQTGEENVLSWETFPYSALSKTYNVDYQVADSAGTATAFMTGVKSRFGVISVNEKTPYDNCTMKTNNEVLSLIMMAEQNGLATGVVTTARITHATPATSYSHASSRGWENDADLKGKKCPDIASQLIDFPYGDGIDVALGGGRKNFLRNVDYDVTEKTKKGKRTDGRNLMSDWVNKSDKHVYVHNNKGFSNLKPESQNKVLGLFNYDHLNFEYYRERKNTGEPSLTEMVEFAIKSLRQNQNGYVLLVEAGRIDHGHHRSKPILALHDTVQLGKAVAKAKELVDPNETLMVVTADHSHVFTVGGYPKRGNDIFGYAEGFAKDNKKYTTLAYATGPGGIVNGTGRIEPNKSQLEDPEYSWESLVPRSSETHGGEDVGVYSSGPQAHLLSGVVEQNVIFHVMDYALCLSESKKKICRTEGLIGMRNRAANTHVNQNIVLLALLCVFIFKSLF